MDMHDIRPGVNAPVLTLAQASDADIPLIMEIERSPGYPALVGSYYADEHYRRMAAPTCTYLLARSNGEPVGFAVIRRDDDGMGTAQLHRIAVSPPGQGHGAAFLREICRWVFEEHDIDRLWLDLLASTPAPPISIQPWGLSRKGICARRCARLKGVTISY